MDIKQLVAGLDYATYEKLREAVELGKWADGTPLTAQQKDDTMQLVIAYQALKLDQHDHLQVNRQGELVTKSREQLKHQFKVDADDEIARFNGDHLSS